MKRQGIRLRVILAGVLITGLIVAMLSLVVSHAFSSHQKTWAHSKKGKAVWGVVWAPTGAFLATPSGDKTIKIWGMPDLKEQACLEDHTESVRCVAIDPSGKVLASGSTDHSVRLWSVETHKPIIRLDGHKETVRCLEFSQDGKHLFSAGADGSVIIWDIETRKGSELLNGGDGWADTLAICSDKALAVGGGSYTNKSYLVIVDPKTKKVRHHLEKHTSAVSSLVVCKDRGMLISGSWDKTVSFWDFESGKWLSSVDVQSGGITAMCMLRDQKTIAVAHRVGIGRFAVSLLSIGEKNLVKLWDIQSLEVTSLKGSPSEDILVATTIEGRVILYEFGNRPN